MKKLIAVLAALLVLAVVAGCDKDKPQTRSQDAALVEPCELITKSEAEQLVGEQLKDAEKSETKVVGQKICKYYAAQESSYRLFQVSLTQQAFMPDNGQSPKSIYETIKANFPDAEKVDGIGDDAFIAPPGLHILEGNYYVTIGVGNSDDPNNRNILKKAGSVAVGKLRKR